MTVRAASADLTTLEERIGHHFADSRLLEVALTHRSFSAENGGESNERLEFLGDAVLGQIVADRLYAEPSQLTEGEMSKARASVVSKAALASAGLECDLGELLKLGRGEESSGGASNESLIADAAEALIAAAYIDGGMPAARCVVQRLIGDRLDSALRDPGGTDFKTRLQELAAACGVGPPRYEITHSGPAHALTFEVSVHAGPAVGTGRGSTKKRAAQRAAEIACEALQSTTPTGANVSSDTDTNTPSRPAQGTRQGSSHADTGEPEPESESAETDKRESVKHRKARERALRDREERDKATVSRPAQMVDFEIPEAEIVRKELDKALVGLEIQEAHAHSMKCLRSYYFRNTFTRRLVGQTIEGVERLGVYISIAFGNNTSLVMMLGGSGEPRLVISRDASESDDATEPRAKSAKADATADANADSDAGDPKDRAFDGQELLLRLSNGASLVFVDPVGTGQLFVVAPDELEFQLPEVANFGHDPLVPIAWTTLGQWLRNRRGELKELLTSDDFMVGIGDIYADEILFEAGLRHDRQSSSLTDQDVRRLHRALVSTLFDAMKYGGTSLHERPFTDPQGRPGAYGTHLKVWGLDGQLSARSRTPIRREMYRGSWTYFCDTQV